MIVTIKNKMLSIQNEVYRSRFKEGKAKLTEESGKFIVRIYSKDGDVQKEKSFTNLVSANKYLYDQGYT